MWFDPYAALAEMQPEDAPESLADTGADKGSQGAVSATPVPDNNAQTLRDIQERSERKERLIDQTFQSRQPVALEPCSRVDNYPHGHSVGGRPLTWSGKIVSLDAWRELTEWERHGPRGRMWNGITQSWEQNNEQ